MSVRSCPKLRYAYIGLMSCRPFRAVCFVICANVLSYLRQLAIRPFDRLRGLEGFPYGVRLLVLAAEWSPQAFLGG